MRRVGLSICSGIGLSVKIVSRSLLVFCSWLLISAHCVVAQSNPIVVENAKPGNPSSEWDIDGAGDSSIQGFATDISVNKGETIRFKIKTNATNYRLDIYRLGYYGGLGARKVATVTPSAPLPQTQPDPITDASTGLVDCGNWAESASWAVPATATSGVYIAKLVRTDTGGASHISSLCATMPALQIFSSRPRIPPGRPTTTTVATASTRALLPDAPTR